MRQLRDNHRPSSNTRHTYNMTPATTTTTTSTTAGTSTSTSTNSSQTSLNSAISAHHHHGGKLKIKCHYTDTRVVLTSTDVNYQELKSRIAEKFKTNANNMQLAYRDEEHEKVLIIDDDDLDMARQINRVRHQHKPSVVEKLEIWIQC